MRRSIFGPQAMVYESARQPANCSRAAPTSTKDYPSGTVKARTAALQCARNEYCAFQLVIESAQPVEDIDVRLPRLDAPNGARLGAPNIAIFKEWYVHVRQPSSGYERSSLGPEWYADALLPYRPALKLRLPVLNS